MTCKDCIHFEVCDSGRHIGEYIEDDGVYTDDVEKQCEMFKDKDLFAELPVKMGQTVYRTKGNFYGEEIYEGIIDQIVIHNGGRKALFYVHGHPLHFTVDNLGVDVFLTREKAEKALEVKNGTYKR